MEPAPKSKALRSARRRQLLQGLAWCAAGVSLSLTSVAASADTFPDRPIRLIVPFPAGGPTDIVARPLAQSLSTSLGQPVLVENRGGAGGSVAADHVAKSPADGYTIMMGTVGTHAINPALYKKLPYHAVNDFTPLGLVASAPVALVVNSKSPWASAADLIAEAKRQPGVLTFGSAGNGSPGHLTGEMFSSTTGVKFSHITYRGSAPAVGDLLGQQIMLMFDPVQSVLSQVKGGKLRALAISSSKRSPVLPQVPTFAEAGLTGFEAEAWWAVFAPANLPAPIADKLRKEIEQIVRSDGFRDKLVDLGVTPWTDRKQPFDAFQTAELQKWSKAVKDSGATVD